MSDLKTLLQQAAAIRDADSEGENTALRVGALLVSLVMEMSDRAAGMDELSASVESLSKNIDTLLNSGGTTGVIDTFRDVENFLSGFSDSESDSLKKLLESKAAATSVLELERRIAAIEDARYEVFDSMFTVAAGIWGSIDHTHTEGDKPAPYCLNGLWLTYEEAMLVVATYTTDARLYETYSHVPVRTVIPLSAIWDGQLHRTFELNKTVEVVVFNDFRVENATIPFYGCTKLRKVTGLRQNGSFKWSDSFSGCEALETLEIENLRGDLDLRDSPLLSLDSFMYMATKSDRTVEKTITVNRDAYDRWQTEIDWDNMLFALVSSNVIIATA